MNNDYSKTQLQYSTARETREERDTRMSWFREGKFGIFIHWGLYSQLAGEWNGKWTETAGEWGQQRLNIPSSEYRKLAETWNPKNYDPRSWLRLMRAAGARYACLTTKHHDGFCMWPTKLNHDWNIAITPFGEDAVAQFADACRAEDMKLCLYHSILDWRHPDWPNRPAFNNYAKKAPDKERFKQEYLFPQLRELLTNYGEVGMLWLDGTWHDEAWLSEDGRELEEYVRSLQPGVVLDNRSGYKPPQPDYDFDIENTYSYTVAGDYISPEAELPPKSLPGIDWETCQTMQLSNNWGYNRTAGFKPFVDLLRLLVDVASKGGNLLLNVGPAADGSLLPQTVSCFEKFAAWMAINSESIHGTEASPFESLPFSGRCTRKPGKLYLHVFDWPMDRKLHVPVQNKVTAAYLLRSPSNALTISDRPECGNVVELPAESPDTVDSVVVVEIEGEPVPVQPAPAGAVRRSYEVNKSARIW